ncbi:MAG: TRAP transporter small permease [Pigmentiphaga sp.]|nr:TRAP transporter small permease [Pigmentiphaga sp.]
MSETSGHFTGFWPGLARAAGFAAALCAAVALAGIMFLMLIDVTGRYLFNSPVPGAAEIIELAMGITVFAAMPLVTARDEHIRLDYFDHLMRGRARPMVRGVIEWISAVGMGVIAWRVAEKAVTVINYGDTTPFLRIPVGPVALFIALCAGVSALIFLLHGAQQWRQAIVGDAGSTPGGQAS